MNEVKWAVQTDRVVRWQRTHVLIWGLLVIGWVLLRLGLEKAIRDWAASLDYRLEDGSLHASWDVSIRGVTLRRTHAAIPLDKITDVKLIQGPLLSRVGLWDIQIQTAGQGTALPEVQLHGIENPEQARDEIMAAIAEARRNAAS